jgi:hypothetical protein
VRCNAGPHVDLAQSLVGEDAVICRTGGAMRSLPRPPLAKPSPAEMSPPAVGVIAALAAAAGCGVQALRAHLWIASLGPICGLDRPALFFRHCPACPAAFGFLALAAALAPLALRRPAPAHA